MRARTTNRKSASPARRSPPPSSPSCAGHGPGHGPGQRPTRVVAGQRRPLRAIPADRERLSQHNAPARGGAGHCGAAGHCGGGRARHGRGGEKIAGKRSFRCLSEQRMSAGGRVTICLVPRPPPPPAAAPPLCARRRAAGGGGRPGGAVAARCDPHGHCAAADSVVAEVNRHLHS